MVSDKSTLAVTVDDIYNINIESIRSVPGVVDTSIKNNTMNITSKKEVSNLDKLINIIERQNVKILNLGFKDISLETVFLTLTGRTLRD